jgi:hypothetical protein
LKPFAIASALHICNLHKQRFQSSSMTRFCNWLRGLLL